MKVFAMSCETGPHAGQHQAELLRSLWSKSSRRHEFVDGPESADVILIGNIPPTNWYASLRRHPVIRQYPNRCFAVSETWELLPLLRGVYTNAHRHLPFWRRFRSGSYTLYHPDFKNPFIENHAGHAYDRPKRYLATFTGRNCHPVRAALFAARFRRPDIAITDTSAFNAFTHDNSGKEPHQRSYARVLEESKFALCPRGSGAASIRLFEAMQIGVAPVILSDDWIFPAGPDWKQCAIVVRERDVDSLEEILSANEPRYREIGRAAAEAFGRYFSRDAYFDYLIGQIEAIARTQRIPEAVHWFFRDWIIAWAKLRTKWQRYALRHRAVRIRGRPGSIPMAQRPSREDTAPMRN